jgi:hypothetical protein
VKVRIPHARINLLAREKYSACRVVTVIIFAGSPNANRAELCLSLCEWSRDIQICIATLICVYWNQVIYEEERA